MARAWTIGWGGLATVLALAAGGCKDSQTSPQPVMTIEKAATKSGDQQTAAPGAPLIDPLRVVVTRDGEPASQVSVTWLTPSGGTMGAASSLSNDNGIAVMTWNLGPTPGIQTARASVIGATNSPITFTATAEEGGGGPPPEPVIVMVSGPPVNKFSPAEVTIQVGQTVTWTWAQGATGHNVTPDDGSIPEGENALSNAPHSYSYTFDQAGTYHYHCAAHGATGMTGTVIVETTQ